MCPNQIFSILLFCVPWNYFLFLSRVFFTLLFCLIFFCYVLMFISLIYYILFFCSIVIYPFLFKCFFAVFCVLLFHLIYCYLLRDFLFNSFVFFPNPCNFFCTIFCLLFCSFLIFSFLFCPSVLVSNLFRPKTFHFWKSFRKEVIQFSSWFFPDFAHDAQNRSQKCWCLVKWIVVAVTTVGKPEAVCWNQLLATFTHDFRYLCRLPCFSVAKTRIFLQNLRLFD